MTITVKFYEYGVNKKYPELPYCVDEQRVTFKSFEDFYKFLDDHAMYHNSFDTFEKVLTMTEMKSEEIDWD